jgi:hypothetical protein
MCLDEYYMRTIVHQRLEEERAFAARAALLAEFQIPWRVSVGMALVRFGERLAGSVPARVRQPLLS